MPPKIPCPQKVILRPSAIDRRQLLSIDKKHVVALAPPPILIFEHRHGHAHKMPAPRRLEPNVISIAVKILPVVDNCIAVRLPLVGPSPRRSSLPVLRMKIEQ